MPDWLKNALLTALAIVGATAVTSAVAVFTFFFMQTREHDLSMATLLNGGPVVATFAALLGTLMFAPAALFVAALTMPPTLALSRSFNLPRPTIDIVGGALAGTITSQMCCTIFIEAMTSLARSKGGDAPDAAGTLLFFAIFGFLGGAILGWLRHRVLTRQARRPSPAQFAY